MDETGRLHEDTFNVALGRALRRCRSAWRTNDHIVRSERSQTLVDEGAKRPDVLVSPPDGYPIAIECEYGEPAINDAKKRLGKRLTSNMLPIRSAIAVGIPSEAEWWSDFELENSLAQRDGIDLKIVVLSADIDPDSEDDVVESDIYRWPDESYVIGDVLYLADLCEGAIAPPNVVEIHATSVADSLRAWASGLQQNVDPGVGREIAHALGQDSVEQGLRLACCIWLTSLRLHDMIAEIPGMRLHGIRKLAELRETPSEPFTLSDLRDAWHSILSINYKSIFVPALNALNEGLPTLNGAEVLDGLARRAERVTALRLGNSVDFAGELFPKLLDDRKDTASYYTLPTTAHLLAGIAVARFHVTDWSDTSKISALRIADFACGTGTLLRAAYSRIRKSYEEAGGDDLGRLHEAMLENGITGTDINSLAAHMTAAALSSFDMKRTYRETNIGAIPIPGGTTGALEFLTTDSCSDVVGQYVVRTDSPTAGGATIGALKHSYDLVIQNPPYTSPVAGENSRKMFDVAGISEEDRQTAVKRLNSQRSAVKRKGVNVSHGRAGMGTDFSALADLKLKSGGVFASVLPLSAARAESWSKLRTHFEHHYSDLTAIAYTTDIPSQMSADTNMNEMLVIATKLDRSDHTDVGVEQNFPSVLCVNLRQFPRSINESEVLVREINSIAQSNLNSGALRSAGRRIGDWARFPVYGQGFPWAVLGMRDAFLSTTLCNLFKGVLKYTPLDLDITLDLPMISLKNIVQIGPTHSLIGHVRGSETGRGAFVFDAIEPGDISHYPSLWDAKAEGKMQIFVDPTHDGTPLSGRQDRVDEAMSTRSNSFISQDARFTSQALTAARTKVQCLGSATWVAMMHDDQRVLDALVLWFNSTLGILLRTGYGNTSQPGRPRIAVESTGGFPVPDFSYDSELGEMARNVAHDNFERLAELRLQPASYAWVDENRHKIDNVVLEMFGIKSGASIEALTRLRDVMCREPSVHGGKRDVLRKLGIQT